MEEYEELDYETLREQKKALEDLLDSQGWKLFEKVLEARAVERERQLYSTRPKTMEQLIEFNSIAAAIDEDRLIPQMLYGMYSDTETAVKKLLEEMEDAERDEADD